MSLDNILLKSIENLIKNSTSDKKINSIINKHTKKLHFIPFNYRILGGILQSMNIQFGNFIEELMRQLVKNNNYEILKEYSGKKVINLQFQRRLIL